MSTILQLPDRFTDNFGDPIAKLFLLQNQIFHCASSSISLNYSGAKFTHPFFTLTLPLLKIINERKGIKISLNTEFVSASVKQYMDHIKFPSGLIPENITEEQRKAYFEQYKNKTYVPIINFPTSEESNTAEIRDNVLSVINELITYQSKLTGAIKIAVMYLIDEAVNNIINHSRDERGYILLQYYPSKGFIDICIADIGRTLLETYKDSGRHKSITNDREAMIAALVGKSTKSNNVDRGFGISTSKKMLTKGLTGKYLLYSSNFFNIIRLKEMILWNFLWLTTGKEYI